MNEENIVKITEEDQRRVERLTARIGVDENDVVSIALRVYEKCLDEAAFNKQFRRIASFIYDQKGEIK